METAVTAPDDSANTPAGWSRHTRTSPAITAWEPIYARTHERTLCLGIRIGERHCNSRGLLHGGIVATLADNAMGLTLGLALDGATQGILTQSMTIDYIGAGRLGQWLEISPRLVHAGKRSGVVDALLTADGEIVARANGSFRIV